MNMKMSMPNHLGLIIYALGADHCSPIPGALVCLLKDWMDVWVVIPKVVSLSRSP